MSRGRSIYFVVPSPAGIYPSQRFRFEHYLPWLRQQGYKIYISPFFSFNGRRILYSPRGTFKKAVVIAAGLGRRVVDIFRMLPYRFVFIHREAAPAGPPVFEWIVAKILRKKIIYDFDDAIWVPVMSDYNKSFMFLRFFGKVASVCKWSYKVSAGNEFLRNYAAKYNRRSEVIATVVDTDMVHNMRQNHETEKPSVGWTGSFSTLPYLDLVLPALLELQEELNFSFYVIADRDPQLPLKNYKFIKWQKDTEVSDLLNFHIGLMPLTDDEITRGKCGFKAIQYMSLGIPALVSPVGVNTEIVDHGVNGYICNSTEEWKDKISGLLKNKMLREEMGKAARMKMINNYSVAATQDQFLRLFE